MAVKHINITMPEELIRKIDRIAPKQRTTRSGFIMIAVTISIENLKKKALREKLKKGYQELAGETQKITKEMRSLEEESLKHIGDDLIEW